VSAAAVNFAQTARYFHYSQVTGVPVRPEIFEIPARPLGSTTLRLLVTAGSNGALVFNETMPKIVGSLLEAVPGLTIVHQSGPRQLEQTRDAYMHYCAAYLHHGFAPERFQVEAFFTDMPAQYAAADLVLARAGSTVAELCAAGRASLLVPFAGAADDHQRKNAEALVAAGAAQMMLQSEVTAETLLAALLGLLSDETRRTAMAARAKSLARPGALERIAGIVLQIAQNKKG